MLLIVVPITICVVLGVENHAFRVRLGLLETAEPENGMLVQAADPENLEEPNPAPEVPPTVQPAAQPTVPPTVAPTARPEVERPAYEDLFPELYAAPAARSTVNSEKTAYLTFDDGPSVQTPKILTTLAEYDVKATFFVVGQKDEQGQQWMRDIADAGHTLGVHTFSHHYEKIYASVEAYLDDFNEIYQQIYAATGNYPQVFRFPGGSINRYNQGLYQEIIAEMTRRGFVYFDWNVSAADAATTPATVAGIQSNVLGRTDKLRRAFVLMHDSAAKGNTAAALPGIIEGYQAAGFTLAPLTPEVLPVAFGYTE
ncbi:MAG: polysaccharide deacetylase family protein [Pseudoflavonifractor sp.]